MRYLKIKDNVSQEEIEKYAKLIWHTCYIDNKLNTYRYRLKSGDEIELTNKGIHFGNSNCEWLLEIYDFLNNIVEVVED